MNADVSVTPSAHERTRLSEARWTTRSLLAWMIDAFTRQSLDAPRLFAELLLAHVIGCDRLRLYMDPDRPASPLERDALRALVARALKHEPVQYLVGEAWFFSLPFKIDRRVLIPRPATETIAEHVLQHARAAGRTREPMLIADVCTGSGAIAIALAKHLPETRVVATDVSADALELAQENVARHNLGTRVELLQGDLLAPLESHPVAGRAGALHYLVSNPPYIPDDEWDAVAPNVREHEPELALRAPPDGLTLIRPLIDRAPFFLRPGGQLLIECAASRAGLAAEIARANPSLTNVRALDDFEGLPRVLLADRA
ncbi:MAG: peptide chain release factor N(5)-glutamine methyltransferase [Phycisphaerales bacterium]|jgi:release factor glutamine methyltransferase|nr:peptide chain release factor N(5)-glutamine methyltransferase [Phycisphaerales bacterium]